MKKLLLGIVLLAVAAIAQAAEPLPPAARTIVLVRHGHYVADAAADPKLGPGLSPLGVAQAHLLGARLAGLPEPFDALYVSPLQRARDTAATIADDFPGRKFAVLDDLAECTPPTRDAGIMAGEKPADLAACQAQLDRLFAAWFHPATGAERAELFVCHGNVIRYLVTRALGIDTRAWLGLSVGHASITRIRIEADGRIKVTVVGDVGHLSPNLLTGASGDGERSLAIAPLPADSSPALAGAPAYDGALATRLGADARGMRAYVLVILKTGPTRTPDGPKRDAMFAGHFANMGRLAKEGKLVLAGPFEKEPAGWRGLFLFAVKDVAEARRLTATDPVIVNGEMVAEFHPWYGSAAAMMLPEIHERLTPPVKPGGA
jgi:serine/threonine-protein phosphatase PGAM5